VLAGVEMIQRETPENAARERDHDVALIVAVDRDRHDRRFVAANSPVDTGRGCAHVEQHLAGLLGGKANGGVVAAPVQADGWYADDALADDVTPASVAPASSNPPSNAILRLVMYLSLPDR